MLCGLAERLLSGGLAERLLSGALAGPSGSTAPAPRTRAHHGSWNNALGALRGSGPALPRQAARAGGRRLRGLRRGSAAGLVVAQALQAADYSFYQRLREGELTEEWLWETRLLPLLGYLSADEATAVREALSLAHDAHSGQRRKSGEPFITHPVEVARILAELRMDYESLVAGLLHDTVEDCGDVVGLEEIGFHFGAAVRRIVEGETKFSKLPTHHPEDRNSFGGRGGAAAALAAASAAAEAGGAGCAAAAVDPKAQDLQFLFLAMTEEVRIIVVKLADRLHNMRTMASMPPAKQRRIAQETLQVFAPLARLLGLYSIKEELEELSFKYALPAQYDQVRRAMAKLWDAQAPVVEAARRQLEAQLQADPYLQARVDGVRVEASRKALYSTYRKLQEAGKTTRELGDVAQLRVVLSPRGAAAAGAAGPGGAPAALDYGSEKQLCYHVMGLVHASWAPIPGAMKDYIATPKPNNYQSLHTTVVPTGLDVAASLSNGASGGAAAARRRGQVQLLFPIEVQIRTDEMDRLAENGIAVESWSCAASGRWRPAGVSEYESALEGSVTSTYGSLLASAGGSSGSLSSGESEDEAAAAAAAAAANGADAAARRRAGSGEPAAPAGRFPFNLGAIVSQLAGGQRDDPPSSSSSSSSNGSDADAAPAAAAAAEAGPGSNGASTNGAAASGGNGGGRAGGGLPAVLSSSDSVVGDGVIDPQVLSRRINWLKSIREWQEEFVGTLTASEFVECITDDLLGQSVFVFTPSGEVVRLPKGATVVDFAYHIHTEMGNTMVAAKVNGKVVPPDRELQNAEVVEVVRYRGPVNATIIKRHQQWLDAAQTRTARHKIAKFLRQHAALAVSKGMPAPPSSTLGQGPPAASADTDARQVTWLVIQCDDRPGLLAEVANVIARHGHNITAYSGSADVEAGLFVMEYELEGRPSRLQPLCEELSCIESVSGWSCGCALPEQARHASCNPPR